MDAITSITPLFMSDRLQALSESVGLNSPAFKAQENSPAGFDSIFQAYMSMLNETSAYQNVSDQAELDFAAGRTDDMLGVMLAQEKAFSTLNFTIQVTNKVVEAYREIMRIQL